MTGILPGVPEERITYAIKFTFNHEECQIATYPEKDEAILCVAEKHEDILSQNGWDDN